MSKLVRGKNGKVAPVGIVLVVLLIGVVVLAIVLISKPKDNSEVINNNKSIPVVQEPVEDVVIQRPGIEGDENTEMVDGAKINTSSKLKEDKTFLTYKFTNIKLQTDNMTTVLLADVSSSSTEKTQGKDITIKFYNKEGEQIAKMNSYIGQIKVGETNTFRAATTADLANAYDFEIVEYIE